MAIREQRLKVAQFNEMNDPFELYAMNMGNPEHRKRFKLFREWANSRFGVLCLSRTRLHPLLWSHYADRHRGVALEIEVDSDLVNEITYQPNRLRVAVEEKAMHGTFTANDAIAFATTKFKAWEYEDEVRIFVKLDECQNENGIYFVPFTDRIKLKGVVLGPLCALSHETIRGVLKRGQKLSVLHTRLAFTSYSVVRQKLQKAVVLTGSA